MKYRSEIDGLRAIAVLAVIFFHAGFSIFNGGYVGVDVFFVISGYLITRILIGEFEQNTFSFARFYERRARRILPALFVVMFACLPFAYMWMLPSQLKDFAQSVFAVVVFLSNVFFWHESGYFAASSELMPLLHTWSLAVEEQYYFLLPIFFFMLWKYGKGFVFWATIVVAILSFLLAEVSWRHNPNANFYLLPTRAWELWVGSICAFFTSVKVFRSSNVLSAIGLILILFAIFGYDENTPVPSVYALAPVLGTALIIIFATEGTGTARLLSMRGLSGIGLISYSAYLWHQPLFAFARLHSIHEPNHVLMGILAFAALLLAWATWRYVERPFRKPESPLLLTRLNVFVTSGAVGLVFLTVGLIGHVTNGLDWRLTDDARRLLATAIPSPFRKECHYGRKSSFKAQESCEYFGEDADVAIYGNSHGVELSFAIAEELQKVSRSIIQFTISGCAAGFRRNLSDYCNQFYEDRLDYLLSNLQVNNVVLTYRAENSGPESAASIVDLANYLTENGKNVVLVVQAPTLEQDISNYINRARTDRAITVESRSFSSWKIENEHVYNSLNELNPLVHVFDLAEYFCDTNVCFAIRDGQALYFDDDHMSVLGARRVAEDIVQLLE